MNIYFFILIALTGILSSYTDIRERKIKNSHLLVICSIALILYSIFASLGILKISPALILNPLIALIAGFFLYAAGLWKPGDAKLFFTYSLLLPVNHYSFMLPAACFVLFINTFLIGFVIISILYLFNIIINKVNVIKHFISIKTVFYFGQIFLTTLCLSWVIQPIINLLPIKPNIFLNFIIIFLAYSLVYKLINSIKKPILVIVVLLLGLILRYIGTPNFFTFSNIADYAKYTAIYSAIFYILISIIELKEKSPYRIPFSPFMFLGALLTNTNFLWWLIRLGR